MLSKRAVLLDFELASVLFGLFLGFFGLGILSFASAGPSLPDDGRPEREFVTSPCLRLGCGIA